MRARWWQKRRRKGLDCVLLKVEAPDSMQAGELVHDTSLSQASKVKKCDPFLYNILKKEVSFSLCVCTWLAMLGKGGKCPEYIRHRLTLDKSSPPPLNLLGLSCPICEIGPWPCLRQCRNPRRHRQLMVRSPPTALGLQLPRPAP